jgi:hypothetical protein
VGIIQLQQLQLPKFAPIGSSRFMNRKKAKPTYGNSQGAKSGNLNADRNSQNKSTLPKQKYAQTDKLSDRKHLQLQSDSTSIHSLPRTIFKLTIAGIITSWLLTHTDIGKSITSQMLAHLAIKQKNLAATQSTLDINKAKESQQKAFDNRWDDAWEKAGGKPEKERK